MKDEIKKIGIYNKGKNNKFINNVVEGADVAMLDEGENTFAEGNRFHGFKKYKKDIKDLPLWLKYTVSFATILSVIFAVFSVRGNKTVVNYQNIENDNTSSIFETATSTIDISEMLSKASSYETVIERQDFLNKYIGDQIRGEGIINQVSRASSVFLVDIKVDQQIITCTQELNTENEKRLVLSKGKNVRFVGVFPFSTTYGHGLSIDDCVLEIIN